LDDVLGTEFFQIIGGAPSRACGISSRSAILVGVLGYLGFNNLLWSQLNPRRRDGQGGRVGDHSTKLPLVKSMLEGYESHK
jgi:hypothetical protein